MRSRQRALHLTLRHCDVSEFDTDGLLHHQSSHHITLLSVFIAGYVTLYPSALPWQRQAPGLDGRDLAGEIIDGCRVHDIRVVPAIDLGEVPIAIAEADPGAVARHQDGSFHIKTDGIVSACPLGRFVREHGPQVIREVSSRYRIDGLKFVAHPTAGRRAYTGATPAAPPTPATCRIARTTRRMPPAVHASFHGGADGLLLSREYDFFSERSLRAVKAGLD